MLVLLVYVTIKLVYSYMSDKQRARMYPDALPNVRKDSALIADLEEFHLKNLHQIIMQPILAIASGIPMVILTRISVFDQTTLILFNFRNQTLTLFL